MDIEAGQDTPSGLEHSTPTVGFTDEASYTYDAANLMTAAGGVSYGYDVRGNQTSRGSDSFEWDHENRLTEVVIDSVTSTYAYNGDGLRMSKTVDSTTTSYVWDIAAAIPVVIQDGTYTYLYGLGLISITDASDEQVYCLRDGLGSTINLVDDAGQVLVTYAYDVFGAIRSQTGSSDNVWLFAGEQRDGESGYDFLRARYYDPEIGRFLSRDPAGQGNFFSYVGNNPVNLTDPTGLCMGTFYSYAEQSWLPCDVQFLMIELHLNPSQTSLATMYVAQDIVGQHGMVQKCYAGDTYCSLADGFIFEWAPPNPVAVGQATCGTIAGQCVDAVGCGWPFHGDIGQCSTYQGDDAVTFCSLLYCPNVSQEMLGEQVPYPVTLCGVSGGLSAAGSIAAALVWEGGPPVWAAAGIGCGLGLLGGVIMDWLY